MKNKKTLYYRIALLTISIVALILGIVAVAKINNSYVNNAKKFLGHNYELNLCYSNVWASDMGKKNMTLTCSKNNPIPGPTYDYQIWDGNYPDGYFNN